MVHGLLGRPGSNPSISGLVPRLALSSFLAMGVMVSSLALYGMEGEAQGEAALAVQGLFRAAALLLSLPVVFLLGIPLVDGIWRSRSYLSADSLIVVGVSAAFAVSVWHTVGAAGELEGGVYYDTATMVLVLVGAGKCLDTRARERAASALTRLARADPSRSCDRLRRAAEPAGSDSAMTTGRDPLAPSAPPESCVPPEELSIGDVIRVRPGERIGADGRVLSGGASVSESDLTGEELPRRVRIGDSVWAGTWIVDGAVDLAVDAIPGECLSDRIEALLGDARTRRAPIVHLADRVSAVLLPVTLTLALVALGLHWQSWGPQRALLGALSILLIACPCALGLATPLAFWVALGEAWRGGVLVRSGAVLERLARVRRVFFDKTGTLTTGEFELREVTLHGDLTRSQALEVASALEQGSEHPIARALVHAATADRLRGSSAEHDERTTGVPELADDFSVLPGRGVRGSVGARSFELSWDGPNESHGPRADRAPLLATEDAHTEVWLWDIGRHRVLAGFRLSGMLRPDARSVIDDLKRVGLEVAVLTGDGEAPAARLALELDVKVESRLLPDQKAERVSSTGSGTLFVGDGLNDAPAFACADVSVAVRGASPRSLEQASVGLLQENLRGIPEIIELARRALGVARFNLLWAFAYNGIGLALAFQGKLSPVFAAGAMVLSSAVIVLNSTRLRFRRPGAAPVPLDPNRNPAPCPSTRSAVEPSTA